MKKLIVIMVALVLTLGVSAQKRGGFYARPRAYVGVGIGYSPFYYSPFYNPWYYPGYGYNNAYGLRPSKLDIQIADIKHDYSDRIWSAKRDTSLSHRQRRREVRQLKHDRDNAIRDAQMNYHRTR